MDQWAKKEAMLQQKFLSQKWHENNDNADAMSTSSVALQENPYKFQHNRKTQNITLNFNSSDERVLWMEDLCKYIEEERSKEKERKKRLRRRLVEKHIAQWGRFGEIKRPLSLEKEQLRAVRKDLQQ